MDPYLPFAPMNGGGGQNVQHRYSTDSAQDGHNGRNPHPEMNGTAPLPMAAPARSYGGMGGDMPGLSQAGLPRSPPKNKNTQHVPCKFFFTSQCQAGRTCPFSHDQESTNRPAPCKYFAKGGCKFGRKCALLHVTPDGHIVNQGPRYSAVQSFGPPPQPAAGTFAARPASLLSMQAQGMDPRPNGVGPYDHDSYQHGLRNGNDYSQVDFTYTSASPPYGSPQHDNYFPTSPLLRGLSVLDAPLPNSFDSNGISLAARHGPFAASVPSRFGIDSPPASLPRKAQFGTALRDLQNSAFGEKSMDGVLAGSSPPSGPDEPLTFPKRPLHSDRLRAPRQPIMSASLGTKLPTQSFEYSDDDDLDFDMDRGEDLLPASLRELIPESRARSQRSRAEDENSPATFLAAQRRTLSGHGTPQDSKVGSPYSSSPSRFTSLFHRGQNGRTDEPHVGSPLRNGGFGYSSPASRTASGDLSPTFGSPPRQASMSALTQELQRTKLDAARSQVAASVGMSRTLSNGSTGRTSLDRAVSGSSVSRERIDEEQDLFDMEEVGDSMRSAPRTIPNSENRNGGAWNTRSFGSPHGYTEPSFGAIGGHRTTK